MPEFCDGAMILSALKYTLKNMYLLIGCRKTLAQQVFRYCAVAQIGRKTAHSDGKKRWIYRRLDPSLGSGQPDLAAGGTATGFMTNGVHITFPTDGFAVRGRARGRMQPRPSLGSSHALLLLSRP